MRVTDAIASVREHKEDSADAPDRNWVQEAGGTEATYAVGKQRMDRADAHDSNRVQRLGVTYVASRGHKQRKDEADASDSNWVQTVGATDALAPSVSRKAMNRLLVGLGWLQAPVWTLLIK